MQVYLLATLDTKGQEAALLKKLLQEKGVSTLLVDTGSLEPPTTQPDIPREQVFAAAGVSLAEVVAKRDRGYAVEAARQGATNLVLEAHQRGALAGVLGIGGSAGTTIASCAMRALPLGIPKLMVSTLASGQVRHYVLDRDILMMNSVVDFSGINRISRTVLTNAAFAMAGMVAPRDRSPRGEDPPLIAASMFGVTTPCITAARGILEKNGFEVLVFHATGNGGQAMESIIADGQIEGVLDITTTELADELVGGVLSAGPERLTAAARRGVPQVVSVGATDMVNFHARDTVPLRFSDRVFYQHNANVTLMRTTPEENEIIGRDIGTKLANAPFCTILLPKQGVSAIDRQGQPFDDPRARAALFRSICESAGQTLIVELDAHINDPAFAEFAARRLLELIADHRARTWRSV